MKRTVRSGFVIALFCLPGVLPCGMPPESFEPREIHDAANGLLNAWYPRVVDTEFGGFIPMWSWNWENLDDNRKGVVTQSRHTWSASKAALFFPDNPVWGAAAHAGFAFLKDAMWDTVCGGFYEFRDRTGRLTDPGDFLDTKRAYGNAFAIFALSAYHEWTGNPEALELAEKTFLWLDRHARDPVYGGYFNTLLRDGTPMHRTDETFGMWDAYLAGLKDYNSTIHLLEAFTSLYKIRPDSLLGERLNELVVLVRDTFVRDGGYLHLFFEKQWAYIRDFMIDPEYGCWYETGPDTDPQSRFKPKGHHWKTPYHHLRALLECAARLGENEK